MEVQADGPSQATTRRVIEPEITERVAILLSQAKRPVLIAGSMVYWSNCGESLRRLVDTTKIPLFTIERARGILPDDHPYCFGDGYSSINPVAQMFHHADVVLVLGERLDCRFAYGKCFGPAKVVYVYPDSSEADETRGFEICIRRDPQEVIGQLLESASEMKWAEKADWVHSLRETRRQHETHQGQIARSVEAPLHPLCVAEGVNQFLTPDTILVFDNGDFSAWVRSYLRARRPGGWQVASLFGHLGTGLPYALGAQVACPESRVVLLTGDGALGFCIMEMETAARRDLPVVVVVGNDRAWGIEKFYQTTLYGPDRSIATGLLDVRWDRMASAMGCHGERVETQEDLQPALKRAFDSNRPACVDVTTKTAPSPLAVSYARFRKRRSVQARRAMND